MGAARARRYGLLRSIRNLPPAMPVYRVSEAGEFWFESSTGDSPLSRSTLVGAGSTATRFFGRLFSPQNPNSNLPLDVRTWDAPIVLLAMSSIGELPSNLLFGEHAHELWSSWRNWPGPQLGDVQTVMREGAYPLCVAKVIMDGQTVGSSAAGEQSQFCMRVLCNKSVREVIVKFSPPISEAIGQRWSGLLIAEHLALETLRAAGVPAANSEIIQARDRTVLEVDHFDRIGAHGRRDLISIGAADAEFTGTYTRWLAIASALAAERRLGASDVNLVVRISAFGHLIANNDMHNGNLGLLHGTTARLVMGSSRLRRFTTRCPCAKRRWRTRC